MSSVTHKYIWMYTHTHKHMLARVRKMAEQTGFFVHCFYFMLFIDNNFSLEFHFIHN